MHAQNNRTVPPWVRTSIVFGCCHGDKNRVTWGCLCFKQQKNVGYAEDFFPNVKQTDNFAFYLTEMEGSVLSVAIIDGREWLEGPNSSRPLEARIRFVSKDLPQVNVSSPLALTKTDNRSVRTNPCDLNHTATFGKTFLFYKLMPGDEPELRETWRIFIAVCFWMFGLGVL